jgi:hypothetical protein
MPRELFELLLFSQLLLLYKYALFLTETKNEYQTNFHSGH